MTLSRLPHEPGTLVDFYQESLESLGAICERTWFDRLQLVAEGRAARLWNADGALHEMELSFPPPDSTAPRDAAREVFPGCPLTFRLSEAVLPRSPRLERALLAGIRNAHPPDAQVAEKLWRARWPGDGHWRLESRFTPTHHFSLITLARCEIQAIDQHWSLHRLAISVSTGESDNALADTFDFAELASHPHEFDSLPWPDCPDAQVGDWIGAVLTEELDAELGTIRRRQENYLRRELDRIDQYFANYVRELSERAANNRSDSLKLRLNERLAAAKAEHARRRDDQVQRHEIRVIPRLDAFLLLAEPAWTARVTAARQGKSLSLDATYVPRCRRWFAS